MYSYITRDDMVEYVKAELGSPVLEIELELEEKNGLGHIHLAIQNCLDWFIRENQDEGSFHDWMVLRLKAGIIEYDVPEEVTDVIDVAPSFGNGFTPWTAFDVGAGESLVATTGWSQFDLVTYAGAMRYLADVQKLVGVQYQVRFHAQAHKLRIIPTPRSDRVALCRIYRKAAMAEIFANPLFRDFVVARVEILWGKILSRDDYQFPGGGKVNGQKLLDDATKRYDELMKQIRAESATPFILTDLDM